MKKQLHNIEFSGSLSLSNLPSALRQLHLHNNQFGGEVDLKRLPAHIESLTLGNNVDLKGELDYEHLPISLLFGVQYDNTAVVPRYTQ